VAFEPVKFIGDVRREVARVTWPSRKETAITTALVFGMVILASVFFLVIDQIMGLGVRALFGAGISGAG
jgi:preprotein translocase subunit SecE